MTGTVLLTGATGFLGGYVLQQLDAQGYNTVVLRRATSDITDLAARYPSAVFVEAAPAEFPQLFADHSVATVVHLACDQGRKGSDLNSMLQTNVMLGIALLQAAVDSGVTRFLNADTQLEADVNAYARSKKQFAQWLPTFAGSLCIANMRLGNIYGPGEPASGFLSWLISEFARQPASIDFTPGKQLRDFVHVSDVTSAIGAIMQCNLGNGLHCFDVGSGQRSSLKHFVELTKEVYAQECGDFNTVLNFGGLPYRSGEVMSPTFDTAALFALGWQPRFTLESGLRETIRAHRSSANNP